MSTHYSREKLEEISGGDQEFMIIVAKTFLEEIPPDLHALEEAVSNDNKELAYQFAHKMKPNFEMFGLGLEKDITSIETWTRSSKNNNAIQEQMERVVETVNTVFDELKRDFSL
ncbi:Hpt domain-containing protein [Rasiella rasia]|uniref:Hpt domain-containing protein n=1 Tax=Rasiella rasia TaxID=2744027 RepID=A0A6G6GKB4_9FLAO|nr:Hpt domain-containing protein [Rasiella rasia]QIE58999.1 Hpt domain-containing protein [Rasiella rasia]